MSLKRINFYLITQITKYFLLILFIFLSISWLLQITRLFTVTNFMRIQILDIIFLSFYLVPNILTVIMPFILIFGLLLCFIKLNKDNELIAILSLGFGLKPFRNSLLFFCFGIIFVFTILNFYVAPKVYKSYKIKEYDLRNTLNFDTIDFSNFLNLNKTTILDFSKNNNQYEDIFISFNDDKENIVYAKKGDIFSQENKYNFKLTDGFKISIDKNKQIEKLEFLNYVLNVENQVTKNEKIIDKNTLTIFDDLNNQNYLNIAFKTIDIVLIIYIVFFFYNNNLKKIIFDYKNNIYFCFLSISILLLNQILKNSEIQFINYSITILSIIVISLLFSLIKKMYEKN